MATRSTQLQVTVNRGKFAGYMALCGISEPPVSQLNSPIFNTGVNEGAIEVRAARVNTSAVQHQTPLNTPGVLSKHTFSSRDNDDGIAL